MNDEIKKEIDEKIKKEKDKKLNKVVEVLLKNKVNIPEDTIKEGENLFNKSYYPTVLRLANLPKSAAIVLSAIHEEICNIKGVFQDNPEKRSDLVDQTGYSRSIVNKSMQALHKPLKILNNQPSIIPIIEKSKKGKILPNRYMINPYLYNRGDWHETRKRRLYVTLCFEDAKDGFDISIQQVNAEKNEILMDTDDFNFDLDKALEKLKLKNPERWGRIEF